MKPYCAMIELKAIELYFRAVMLITLCKVVVSFTSILSHSYSTYVFRQVPWLAKALLTDSALIRLLSRVSPQMRF